ncbi:hypothetical protein [Nocardia sp. NPDC006630]|uniref:hypothetical protein n=1 Tax=Nocardia sp. NPDC006630 TaxID=3157181 RepID=UPI0033B8272C
MYVNVSPEVLPAVSATLTAAHTSLTSLVGAAMGPAKPIAGGQDSVGKWASSKMASYHETFFGSTTPGLAHLLDGAKVLIPVGDDYEFSDTSGGVSIVSSVSGLQV